MRNRLLRTATPILAAVLLAAAPAGALAQDRVDLQGLDSAASGRPAPETGTQAAPAGDRAAKRSGDADARVDALLDDPKKDPVTGKVEAESGGAEPVESWFGCQPSEGEQDPACDNPGTQPSGDTSAN